MSNPTTRQKRRQSFLSPTCLCRVLLVWYCTLKVPVRCTININTVQTLAPKTWFQSMVTKNKQSISFNVLVLLHKYSVRENTSTYFTQRALIRQTRARITTGGAVTPLLQGKSESELLSTFSPDTRRRTGCCGQEQTHVSRVLGRPRYLE